jgi:hypothetical protein
VLPVASARRRTAAQLTDRPLAELQPSFFLIQRRSSDMTSFQVICLSAGRILFYDFNGEKTREFVPDNMPVGGIVFIVIDETSF